MTGDQNSVGASSNGPTPQSFASLTTNSNGVKSFLGTTGAATNNAMAASNFLPVQHRTPAIGSGLGTYPPALPKADSFDANGNGNATTPLGTPFSATPPTLSAAVIRNLPADTDERLLRAMLVFSKDLARIEFLPDDKGFRAAHLKFKSPAGAQEVKNNLDGKPNVSNDADIIVEIVGPTSPTALGKRYPSDATLPVGTPATGPGAAPTAPSSRQTSRFNGHFHAMEKTAVGNGAYNGDFRTADGRFDVFGPQSPIGTHPNERNGMLGKSMIDATNDDEDTAQLLGKTYLFAETGPQRRQTAPHIPITSRMANMSLNINTNQAVQPLGQYGGHPGFTTMSPSMMNPVGAFPVSQSYARSQQMPPANPADQNPPCNTLYVGNLPVDTSEEELKALFSKQRGYKRLCFRTKQNGPMCFVEFENVTFATKALTELYGFTLHNSIKGGIRLSFSKNPLGVRTGQLPGQNGQGPMNGLNGGHVGANVFTTASGPPPGLTAPPPPGLGVNRAVFTSSPGVSNPYSSPTYTSPSTDVYDQWNSNLMYGNGAHMMGANGNNAYMMGSTTTYPSHMMGR